MLRDLIERRTPSLPAELLPNERLRSVRVLSVATTVLATVALASLIRQDFPSLNLWVWAGVLILAATTRIGASAWERRIEPRYDGDLFLLNVAAMIAGIWVNQEEFYRLGRPFEPFGGYEALAVVVAFACPPQVAVGALSLAALLAVPLIQLSLWKNPVFSASPIGTPGRTLLCLAGAAVFYASRLRAFRIERELARAKARAQALQSMAQLSQSARRLSAIPLETLAGSIVLLRARHPESSETIDRMERSADRLRQMTMLLEDYEAGSDPETICPIRPVS